jgi:hypothetical protein
MTEHSYGTKQWFEARKVESMRISPSDTVCLNKTISGINGYAFDGDDVRIKSEFEVLNILMGITGQVKHVYTMFDPFEAQVEFNINGRYHSWIVQFKDLDVVKSSEPIKLQEPSEDTITILTPPEVRALNVGQFISVTRDDGITLYGKVFKHGVKNKTISIRVESVKFDPPNGPKSKWSTRIVSPYEVPLNHVDNGSVKISIPRKED